MKIPSKILLLAASCASPACMVGPQFLKQEGALTHKNGGAPGGITQPVLEAESVIVAAVAASATETQVIVGPAGLPSTGVSFPPGAIGVDTEVRIEEAASLATSVTVGELGLEGGFAAASAAVLITSSVATEAATPFTVALALPPSSALALTSGLESLVVLYRVVDAAGNATLGVIPRSAIVVKGDALEFQATRFGAYQAVFAEKPIEAGIEVPAAAPPVAKALPVAVTWEAVTAESLGGRSLRFVARPSGLAGPLVCALVVDRDGVAPFDLVRGRLTAPRLELTVPSDGEWRGRFECVGADGRGSQSPWTKSVATVPPSTDTSAQTATQTSTATSTATSTDASTGAPTLQLTASISTDFGSLIRGQTATRTFTLTNVGATPASGLAGTVTAPYSFAGGWPGAGGSCTTALAPQASCTIVVTFAPTTAAAHNHPLGVVTSLSATPAVTLGLTGVAVEPAALQISSGPTHDFGERLVPLTREKTFLVTNGSSATPATGMSGGGLVTPFHFKGGAYPGAGGTCGATLAPSATCTIVVTFSPPSAGVFNDEIEIGYHDGVAAQTATRALVGSGSTVVRPVSLAIGNAHTCAALNNDKAKCWGQNLYGALGTGDDASHGAGSGDMGDNLPPLELGSGPGAIAHRVAASKHNPFSCAILAGGGVKCWGFNGNGELGLGDTDHRGDESAEMGDSLPSIQIGAGRSARQVALTAHSVCVLRDDASVVCWGNNTHGQLGRGDNVDADPLNDGLVAVDFGAGLGAKQIAAGASHFCAVLSDNGVKCWGANASGQLGLGDTTSRGQTTASLGANLPALPLGQSAKQVALGESHSCALLFDGKVKCWGYNEYGQLGQGHNADIGDAPNELASLPHVNLGVGRTALAIAAGGHTTCAILDNRAVKCWGFNGAGQLGLGHTSDKGVGSGDMGALPVLNLGTGRVAHQALVIDVGQHACVLLDDSSTKCWGANTDGQLGLKDELDTYSPRGPVDFGL